MNNKIYVFPYMRKLDNIELAKAIENITTIVLKHNLPNKFFICVDRRKNHTFISVIIKRSKKWNYKQSKR